MSTDTPKPPRKPWSPESRQRMSEYRKAHPQGNRDPEWWTEARKTESLRRMIAGAERKLREREAGDRGAG